MVVFRWNFSGIPTKFQTSWRASLRENQGDSGGIPAEFQQKIHRKSTEILLKFHRKIRTNFLAESKWNSGGIPDILLDLRAGWPARFRRKFRRYSSAFFSWDSVFQGDILIQRVRRGPASQEHAKSLQGHAL